MSFLGGYSEKQREVIKHAIDDGHFACYLTGAVRSGKSASALVGFCIGVMDSNDRDHVLIGVSIESVLRNMGYDVIDMLNYFGASAYLTKAHGTRIVGTSRHGKEFSVYILGATDERAVRRIQGATFSQCIIDEVVLLSESFVNMAVSRLSQKGSKLWATCNPAGPSHWFKKKWVDKAKETDATVIQFKMEDNPSLEPAVIERFKRSFTGHFYKRMIEGEWVGASGLVYQSWEMFKNDRGYKNLAGKNYLALDWGINNVLACLHINRWKNTSYVMREYVYDSRKEGIALTEPELLDKIKAWYGEENIPNTFVYADPNTPKAFIRILRQAGFSIRVSDNNVLEGISLTAARLASKDILIEEGCENLIEELYGYEWKDDRHDKDVVVKKDDHCCDALRYYAFTTGKRAKMEKVFTVKEGLG